MTHKYNAQDTRTIKQLQKEINKHTQHKSPNKYIAETIPKLTQQVKQRIKDLHTQHLTNTHKHIKSHTDIKTAITYLQQQKHLITSRTDKNQGITLVHIDHHIKTLYTHINDQTQYETINNTNIIKDKINTLADQITNIIDTHIHKDSTHRTHTRRYLLQFNNIPLDKITLASKLTPYWKTHKGIDKPLSFRPVINMRPTNILYNIATYLHKPIDAILRILAPHLVHDSNTMQEQILNTTITATTHFITLDIVDCYSNIPTDRAIDKIKLLFELYEEHTGTPCIDKDITLELLPLILNNSYIYAEIPTTQKPLTIHKKMIKGLPMGLPLSGTCANVFIYMNNERNITEHLPTHNILSYHRMIDDIHILTKDITSAKAIIKHITQTDTDLKYTSNISNDSSIFLDLLLFKNKQNKLETCMYFKLHHRFLYPHPHTEMPTHIITNTQQGEIQRIRNKCTSDDTYKTIMTLYKQKFKEKSYPQHLLQLFDDNMQIKRQHHNTPTIPNTNSKKTYMVLPYSEFSRKTAHEIKHFLDPSPPPDHVQNLTISFKLGNTII